VEVNSTFIWKAVSGIPILVNRAWDERGIVHGFTGKEFCLTKDSQPQKLEQLRAALQVGRIVVPDQVHGREFIALEKHDTKRHADAVIASHDTGPRSDISSRSAVGVISADCVPILFRSGEQFGAIHAGWRGLAAGVIANTLKQCASSYRDIELIIGPCAGPQSYQVGQEVLDQIGSHAVYSRRDTAFYLDLVATASQQIRAVVGDSARIEWCKIDTMNTTSFYSYRREGKGCGRNLSFIVG
jgi:YfiH family protein